MTNTWSVGAMEWCITPILLFVLLVAAFSVQAGPIDSSANVIAISRHGKPVQVDGFPLEWSEENRVVLDSSRHMYLDAINTAEGLAGYVSVPLLDSCGTWVFRFFPKLGVWHDYREITTDTAITEGPFHAMDLRELDKGAKIGLEWIIRWDSVMVAEGLYKIGLTIHNDCGDTLPARVLVGGVVEPTVAPVFTLRHKIQFAFIIVLLVAYLYLRSRVKNFKVRGK